MCAGFQDHDDTPARAADSQQLEDAAEVTLPPLSNFDHAFPQGSSHGRGQVGWEQESVD